MDIGEQERVIIVEPLDAPLPTQEPEPQPEIVEQQSRR